MKYKKAQNLMIQIFLGCIFFMAFFLICIFIYEPEPQTEELIDCKTEGIFIDYKCDDGRRGFATLEEWSEIYEGCYNYKYYYKCEGINQLIIPSTQINHNEKTYQTKVRNKLL